MKQIKLLLVTLTLLCACSEGGPAAVGEPCLTGGDCETGTLCVGETGEDSVCLESCAEETVLCETGEVCNTVSVGMKVCTPGGDTAVGATCEAQADCVLGASCVLDAAGGGTCHKVCDEDGSPGCAAVEMCTEIPDNRYGYCERIEPQP